MNSSALETADPPEADTPPEEDVFVFPVTAAQHRFWVLDQMAPGGNPALNMPLALRLTGTLDRPALERAFAEIVDRHEALRTTFHEEKGQLCQVIAPTMKIGLLLVDIQDFPEAERARVPNHLIREEAETPFDLARGPLCRARLVRVAPAEHLLLITLHHIICDGWSNGLILRELGVLYTAFVKSEPAPLPELPLQFADYADWQTKALASGALSGQFDYWRKQLAGELPTLDLPTKPERRARRAGGIGAPAAIRWRTLPPLLARELKSLGARENASGFMVFLAAFCAMLRQTARGGPEDILVSTPSANRGRSEVEGVVGLFVNPLLLRTSLAGDPSFRELMGRVRRVVLDAFAHGDTPFEWIIEEIKPRRLQVNFIYQQAFLQPAKLPDLILTPLRSVSGGAVFEWTAGAMEDADGVKLCLEYNADLFDEPTIDRMLERYQTALENAAAAMDAPVSQLLPPEEFRAQEAREAASAARPAETEVVEKGEGVKRGVPFLTVHYQLIEIWQELLGVKTIGIKDDFFALGGNSLLALRMLQRVEQACGKALQPAALFKQATIEYLSNELLTQKMESAPTILAIQEKGEKTPIFYLHGDLTGGGYYCMKLSRGLGEDQPFYALPPVDVNAVKGLPSIEQMAAMHIEAIRSVRPHGPYVIGGFCLGGLIAYEVARQFAKAGEGVEQLIIIDATAENKRFKRLRRLAQSVGKRRGLGEDEQLYLFCRWHFLLARLKRWSGLGAREQGRIALHRLAAGWRRLTGRERGPAEGTLPPTPVKKDDPESGGGKAVAASWYDPRWDAPLVFLWATGGYRVRAYSGWTTLLLSHDLIAGPEPDPSREWKRYVSGLKVRELPGSHLACITEHVDELAATVRDCLKHG
jgi:thioesterase domain-containing protein